MTRSWLGSTKHLFIPLVVTGTPAYDPPPNEFENLVRRKIYFDPDPITGDDRSLMAYFSAISYGKANINATVSSPITLSNLSVGDNPTTLAINSHPDAHLFDFVSVVYPTNHIGVGGMAAPGKIEFDPPRTPNHTKGRARFRHDESIGTWAMEILHIETGIGDYYNGVLHPDKFDEMAGAAATHPSTYTKALAGWLDPSEYPLMTGGVEQFELHAVGLPRPSPSGRVAAVRIGTPGSERYLVVEARLKNDHWDRGIDSEGVVVYEFSPEHDSWPVKEPGGPWPPLELRTPRALRGGQKLFHNGVEIVVSAETVGGFAIQVTVGAQAPRAWFVSWGGVSKWDKVNTSATTVDEMGFGDFNGDGKTDILKASKGEWFVSWGGVSKWDKINTSATTVDEIGFGDFNGDGRTDVLSNLKTV